MPWREFERVSNKLFRIDNGGLQTHLYPLFQREGNFNFCANLKTSHFSLIKYLLQKGSLLLITSKKQLDVEASFMVHSEPTGVAMDCADNVRITNFGSIATSVYTVKE